MREDEAYKKMKELRAKNKTFDKFVSKVEFKIERFFSENYPPDILKLEIKKIRQIRMTEEENEVLRAYLSYNYITLKRWVIGEEIFLKETKHFFYTIYEFRSYFRTI